MTRSKKAHRQGEKREPARTLGRQGDRDHHQRRARDLPHPQHGWTAAQRLARYRRMMARRNPQRGQSSSQGYREAQRQTAKLYKKTAAHPAAQ